MIKMLYRIIFPLRLRLWISERVRGPLTFVRCYMHDMKRFRQHYAGSRCAGKEHRLARITALYHVLEKGLSFKEMKPFFGQDKVLLLINELDAYLRSGGSPSAIPWQSARRVLNVYLAQNKEASCLSGKEKRFLDTLSESLHVLNDNKETISDVGGGFIECSMSDIQEKASGAFPAMAFSRYSIRHFSDEPVPREYITKAVLWAQKSPSVCNRQSSRVHAIKNHELISKILEIHGGTRGFTEQVDTLLVVSGDLRVFLGPNERNQVFLDTGIFTMSLLFGLHYQGVGACPLHWCVPPEKDMALRRLTALPDAEVITALIAIGCLPDKFKVANSQRESIDKVLRWV